MTTETANGNYRVLLTYLVGCVLWQNAWFNASTQPSDKQYYFYVNFVEYKHVSISSKNSCAKILFLLPKNTPHLSVPCLNAVCCYSNPIHRPLVIPLTRRPMLERPVATTHRTPTRRPFARRRAALVPIRTRRVRRHPPRPTVRLRSATAVAVPVATRTVPSVPRPPEVDRAATATARPHPAGSHTEPPTDTTHTVSKHLFVK